jgi:hypothetical protein
MAITPFEYIMRNYHINNFSATAIPLNKLIRKFIMKHGREPKVILIPARKHKKYSIPEIAGISRFESVCGVNIRYYDGTKTEVY